MILKKLKMNKGFVLLFAVTLAAILLSIALGVANIALKEIKFTTSAKDTNDAFFAADTGAECALMNDKDTDGTFGGHGVICLGGNVSVNDVSHTPPTWNFIIGPLGSNGKGCANVTVSKDSAILPIVTTIISKGYNIGTGVCDGSGGSNIVEREVQVSY